MEQVDEPVLLRATGMASTNDLPGKGTRPYPWSQDEGLCEVLRDPSLWSLVFDLEDRHAIKRAAKKASALISFKLPPVVKVKDDALMGQLSVELLTSSQGQKCLKKEFKHIMEDENRTWSEFLANRIYTRSLYDKGYDIPELDEVCVEQRPDYWRLVPSKFADWLESKTLEPSDFRVLALYGCAFAILQSGEASEILTVLLEKDQSDFCRFLTDETQGSTASGSPELEGDLQRSKSSPVSLQLEPAEKRKEEETKEVDEAKVIDVPTEFELLRSFESRVESLSVGQLRMYTRLLRSNLKQGKGVLEELTGLIAKTKDLVERINESPWLKSQLGVEVQPSPDDQTSVAAVFTEFQTFESGLSFLIELNDQANVLAGRVGEKPCPSIDPCGTGIDKLTMEFKELVDRIKVEVESISRRDRETDLLLSQLVKLDVDGRVSLLENAEVSTWLEVCRFFLGGETLTEITRKYEQLFGQIRLIGPILVYLWMLDTTSAIQFVRDNILGNHEIAWEDRVRMLAHLRVDQLGQVGLSSGASVNEVAEAIFGVCVGSDRLDELEYLEPLLYEEQMNPICCSFYRAALNAKRNGIVVDTYHDLDPLRISEEIYDRKSRINAQRQHILDLMEESPGMRGFYGKLRVIAKLKFLTPLKQHIEKESTDDLYREWSGYGSLDQMVAAVEAYMRSKSGGRRRSLDHNQAKQTSALLRVI